MRIAARATTASDCVCVCACVRACVCVCACVCACVRVRACGGEGSWRQLVAPEAEQVYREHARELVEGEAALGVHLAPAALALVLFLAAQALRRAQRLEGAAHAASLDRTLDVIELLVGGGDVATPGAPHVCTLRTAKNLAQQILLSRVMIPRNLG